MIYIILIKKKKIRIYLINDLKNENIVSTFGNANTIISTTLTMCILKKILKCLLFSKTFWGY